VVVGDGMLTATGQTVIDKMSVCVVSEPMGHERMDRGHERIVEMVVVRIVDVASSGGGSGEGEGVEDVIGEMVIERRIVWVVTAPMLQEVTSGAQEVIVEVRVVKIVDVVNEGNVSEITGDCKVAEMEGEKTGSEETEVTDGKLIGSTKLMPVGGTLGTEVLAILRCS